MQPVLIFTDASYSGGNNTPKECAAAIKNAGYSRFIVADEESVSAMIQAYKHAGANQLGLIAGVTLTVFVEKRDSAIWFYKYESAIKAFFAIMSLETPSPESAYIVYKNLLHEYRDEKSAELKEALSKSGATVAQFRAAQKLIGSNAPSGRVTLVAKDLEGYYRLLRIVSIRAINKHHNLHNPEQPPRIPSATWEQIQVELGEHLVAIDTLRDNSVLHGAIMSAQKDAILPFLSDYISCCELAISNADSLALANKIKPAPYIPLPIARYMSASQLEDYRVKMAVHLKDKDLEGGSGTKKISIYDPGAPTPDEKSCLMDMTQWWSQFPDTSCFNNDFWHSVDSTSLPLGQVFLPNYDMDIIEVVNYAAQLNNANAPEFKDVSDARMWFESWIAPHKPDNLTLTQFVQRRLNDFCLHQFAVKGLEYRLSHMADISDEVTEQYRKRFDMEFSVIENMGFSGYFLIIYDVVNYAREIGVPVGDGRGSAAGSLVVYCLEVTDVDPIEYGLQFERFLNPERVSMPDIDVDFGDGIGVDRNSVLRFISEKYQQKGTDHPSSSQIANINRYQLKAALSAVRGALGLSQTYEGYLKFVVKQVESSLGIKDNQQMTWEQFTGSELIKGKMKREPVLAKIINMAQALSGKRSTYGVHAGGVVVSPTVITDFSAVECDDKGKYISSFDKDDIEQAGLVKLDLLGLKTLSIVELAVKIVEETENIKLNHRALPKDESDVMSLICDQLLSDIFQLESSGMRDLVSKLQPRNIGEIGVLSALFRPGALDSGMVEDFVDVKFERKPANYEHPALKKVTEDTYGCIVYQEQVMSIVRELAGYSLGEADLLRRAMGKKKIEEMMKQKSVYTYRALQHWREHYLEIGQEQALTFALDVNLSDLNDMFAKLGHPNAINEHGYFAAWENVIPLLSDLLGWTEQDVAQFTQRINDMNYVVKLFKEHYLKIFMSIVPQKVAAIAPEKAEEFATRLYFAVSQMVRFNQIFNKVEKFAGYGFNKSHAIAYSIITYKSAYLKKRHPLAFFSAALTHKDVKVLHDTVTEAKAHFGIQLLTPHINSSKDIFYPEGDKAIRYGLSTLRDMGNFAPIILKEREKNGQFVSLFDFMCRLADSGKKPDKKVMESLSCTGAFDVFIPPHIKQSKINGREFIFWLRTLIDQCSYLSHNKGGAALLHQQLHVLTPFEMAIYYTTLAKAALLKKIGFNDTVVNFKKSPKKAAVSALLSFDDKEDKENSNPDLTPSRSIETLLTKPQSELTAFEIDYCKTYAFIAENNLSEHVMTTWHANMTSACSSSTIDTLNKERHYSGMYITSNPLRVLKVAELASREPPGTYINGYPVKVADIDTSFDRRPISTYGIIRDVQLRTVKREDSNFYGEKMIVFKLEDGAYTVSCMIFGSQASKQFLDKIVSDGTIALIGGEARHNEHGLTISVKAMKRYFPHQDEMLHVVPSVDKRGR